MSPKSLCAYLGVCNGESTRCFNKKVVIYIYFSSGLLVTLIYRAFKIFFDPVDPRLISGPYYHETGTFTYLTKFTLMYTVDNCI